MAKLKKKYTEKLSFDKPKFNLHINNAGFNTPGENLRDLSGYKSIDMFKSLEQFGMFGSGNNANTFFPNANVPNDVVPKPEDFIDVPFRLLSAAIVGAGTWKATDFRDTAILKESRDMLLEKPVYFDHDTDLLNWVGITKSVKWTEAFTNKDGVPVPAGIDGVLAIDAKVNPKIARGVLSGIIFSNSVTVIFDWKPSHTFESEEKFYNQIGEMHADGQMVRRVVTKIYDYYETSLVWLGADPFSKLIDKDGNLKHIDTSSIQYNKVDATTKDKYEKEFAYSIPCGIDKNVLALSKRTEKNNQNHNIMKPEVLIQLAAMLGVKAEDITVESLSKLKTADTAAEATHTANAAIAASFQTAITEFATENKLDASTLEPKAFLASHKFVAADKIAPMTEALTKVTALEAEKTTLTGEVATLKTEVATLGKEAKIGKDFVQMKKDETIRLYKVVAGENSDEAVINLIKGAEPDALEGLLKQYAKDATGKFSASCKKCNSTEFEFRSSLVTKVEEVEEGAEANDDDVDYHSIVNRYSKDTFTLGKVDDANEAK